MSFPSCASAWFAIRSETSASMLVVPMYDLRFRSNRSTIDLCVSHTFLPTNTQRSEADRASPSVSSRLPLACRDASLYSSNTPTSSTGVFIAIGPLSPK